MASLEHELFLTHLRDRFNHDTDAAFVQAKQVAETMGTPGWALIVELIEREIEGTYDRLKVGKVKEQAEYARDLGRIAGLESIERAAESFGLIAKDVEARLQEMAEPETPAAVG